MFVFSGKSKEFFELITLKKQINWIVLLFSEVPTDLAISNSLEHWSSGNILNTSSIFSSRRSFMWSIFKKCRYGNVLTQTHIFLHLQTKEQILCKLLPMSGDLLLAIPFYQFHQNIHNLSRLTALLRKLFSSSSWNLNYVNNEGTRNSSRNQITSEKS